MTHDRFNHLVSLMLQNRRYITSIYQEYTNKKADGFIVAIISETSGTEIKTLYNEDFGCCIFPAETYGFIEFWIYDLTIKQ